MERYSVPFFFDPKYSARLSETCLTSKRTCCEDREYEKDEQNKEEMDSLKPYGENLQNLMI